MRAILMFRNCERQSHKTVSTDHNFWRERAEADSNRGPSAYQPNALPLGQTGSLSVVSKLIAFVELREDKFMLLWKAVIISCQAKNSVQSKFLDELQ